MKLLSYLLLNLLLTSFSYAKMSSPVDISKVRSVTIKDNQIIIVGDAIFNSHLVTTEQSKDSNFVISGQPSMNYEAKGYSVTFVLRSYNKVTLFPEQSEEQRQAVIEQNHYTASLWKQSVELAKALKVGSQVSISITPEEVIFSKGHLKSVSGSGSVKKSN